jgi:uncharacterized protein with gpF-like domain
MSIFSFFRRRGAPLVEPTFDSIPTVKFDESQVTPAVRADIKQAIHSIKDIPNSFKPAIYRQALVSAPKRDLFALKNFILDLRLNDMPVHRAAEIARFIANAATSSITKARQVYFGITEAVWMHSGARCGVRPEFTINADHRAVSGETYRIDDGMLMPDGSYEWPGAANGCKCASKPKVKGFS